MYLGKPENRATISQICAVYIQAGNMCEKIFGICPNMRQQCAKICRYMWKYEHIVGICGKSMRYAHLAKICVPEECAPHSRNRNCRNRECRNRNLYPCSPPSFRRYQIILLGDRGNNTTCEKLAQGFYAAAPRPGVEPSST